MIEVVASSHMTGDNSLRSLFAATWISTIPRVVSGGLSLYVATLCHVHIAKYLLEQ